VLSTVRNEPFKNLVISTCKKAEDVVLAVADAYNEGLFGTKTKPLLTYDRIHKAKKDLATLELALAELSQDSWAELRTKKGLTNAPERLEVALSSFERYLRCIGIADRVIFASKGANMVEESKEKAKETATKIALQAISIAGSLAAPFTGGLSSVAAKTVTETIESVKETMEQMEKMRNLKSPEEQREVASEAFTELVKEQRDETKEVRRELVDLAISDKPAENEQKQKPEFVPSIYQKIKVGVESTRAFTPSSSCCG